MVITKKNLLKLAIKHDGNQSKIAKAAGLTHQAVSDRLKKNPLLKQKIMNVREEALKRAGLTRAFVYRGIKEGCQAKLIGTVDGVPFKTNIADHDTRHKYLKTALELHKDLDPDKEQSVQNIGAIIFQVLHNPNRQRIEVV
jgi:hypothetical protein